MSDVTKVEGFKELNRKLKQLPDRVKRTEILKIQRRLAKPVIDAYAQELPVGTVDKRRFGTTYKKGALSKGVKADTVPSSKSGGNPAIVVRPGRKGKFIVPYYGFMVVKKGTVLGSRAKESRKGKNTVVEEARDRVVRRLGPKLQKEAVEKTAEYIQKQINRLGG